MYAYIFIIYYIYLYLIFNLFLFILLIAQIKIFKRGLYKLAYIFKLL